MFSLDRHQDLWPTEDAQGGSLVSSTSAQSRSEFEAFTSAEPHISAKPPSRSPSVPNGAAGAPKPLPKPPGVLKTGDRPMSRNGQSALPAEKAFSIQIGWRLFRLSGASILSDAPSYFSAYFEEQVRIEDNGGGPVKTLFIDRDPDTFADICRHLQGYWVVPKDNAHYVKLYADAQFYSLPRLISQLFDSEINVSIGGTQFRIPRETFSGPGNSSNFFSLGFAGFFSTREDTFPGLDTRGLLRPPPVQPQSIPNRCPNLFKDLISLARGYPIAIKDPEHRAALLSDCKYYGFKGLMHKIFVHDISYNAERNTSEIVMRLEDIHKSGVSFIYDSSPSDQSPLGGWVYYARPFVDETNYEIVVEIGNQETLIDLRNMRASFFGATKARISSLFQVVADKMALPSNLPLGLMMSAGGASAAPASPANTPLSEDRVKIRIAHDAQILLDGQEHSISEEEYNTYNVSNAFEDYEDTSSNPSSAGLTATAANIFSSPADIGSAGRPSPRPISAMRPLPGGSTPKPPSKKRKRQGSLDEFGEWLVLKGQWRMRVQPRADPPNMSRRGELVSSEQGREIILVAVKLDAVSGQRGRNSARRFIG